MTDIKKVIDTNLFHHHFKDRRNNLIDNKVVGHACLINIEKGKTAEYLVFVHQDHQNCGIGTELTKYIKELAKRLSYQKIWLTVSAFNSCAISVYKKAGFHFVGPRDSDREMVVEIYKNQIK